MMGKTAMQLPCLYKREWCLSENEVYINGNNVSGLYNLLYLNQNTNKFKIYATNPR